ncbi:hypothetical protein ACNRWW_11695 [Metabacillus sp. HB246100]|uniref:hypothetical protein n=1 Tax=Bacillus weihaiensis TaxID=1547283 RepID=UPI00235459A9|nr:hypothetical protein [Bacillus weihaiensis]
MVRKQLSTSNLQEIRELLKAANASNTSKEDFKQFIAQKRRELNDDTLHLNESKEF